MADETAEVETWPTQSVAETVNLVYAGTVLQPELVEWILCMLVPVAALARRMARWITRSSSEGLNDGGRAIAVLREKCEIEICIVTRRTDTDAIKYCTVSAVL